MKIRQTKKININLIEFIRRYSQQGIKNGKKRAVKSYCG